MQLGGLLEDLTVARARAGIEKLVHLTPQTARVPLPGRGEGGPRRGRQGRRPAARAARRDHASGRRDAPRTDLHQPGGDDRRIPPGGQGPGDQVSSGTVNQFGAFEMQAAKVGEDSSIQRMIRLVQSADADKAKIVVYPTAGRHGSWSLP